MIEKAKKAILAALLFLIFTSFMNLYAQWARIYGGESGDYAYSIQQTSDGGYIVAGNTSSFSSSTDVLIIKLDSNGDIEWQRSYGGSEDDWAHSIQQTNDGGYIVAGGAGFRMDDDLYYSFWILKLSTTGDVEWEYVYGKQEFDYAYSVQQTSDGGYIVAGFGENYMGMWYKYLVLKLTPYGNIEWQRTYRIEDCNSASSIQQTSDGGYIVAGETEYFPDLVKNIWILKLTSIGDIEWQHAYKGSSSEQAYSIQQTSDGGYVAVGWTSSYGAGSGDVWVLKLSSDGNIEWQRTYGGSGFECAYSIQQTSDGGYIVAGETSSFGAGGKDLWVLKLYSNGDIEWQKTYGGTGHDSASSIQQTSDGGYIVAGYSESFSAGESDFFIIELSSTGDITPLCGLIGSSNATVTDTNCVALETNSTPSDSRTYPLNTYITPQDSDAIINVICGDPVKYKLTISITTGGATDPSPGTYAYDDGTQVSVTATPNNGYQFNGWSEDISGISNPITITMDSDISITAHFTEISNESEDSGSFLDKMNCFIATAAYGSPLHPYIDILRDFRDKYLMPNKLGRKLVGMYYKYSPFVANLIAKYKALKVIVRNQLIPLIVFSYSMIHFGPIITAIILFCIFSLPVFIIFRY